MRRGFGLQQKSYAVHQEVQVQQHSYGVDQAAAWQYSNKNHHYDDNQLSSGICMEVMPAGPFIDHSHELHNNKISRKHGLHQNGISWHHAQDNQHRNGGCGTSSAAASQHYSHVSSGDKRLPVFNGSSKFSHNGATFTNHKMEESDDEYETFHGARVPATVIVQETSYNYERRSSGWGDNRNLCTSYLLIRKSTC